MPATLYARPHKNEIWALILEKAVAKMCGGYAAIEGGFTEWGIVCLTGSQAFRYNFDKQGDGYKFKCMRLKCKSGVNMNQYPETDHDLKDDDFFQLLQYYDRNGAALCCDGVKKEGEDLGLVTGHAYTLLTAKQCNTAVGSRDFYRFVQIRNPWGDGEWKGNWSDESKLWDEHPFVKKMLKFENKDDGAFWMIWEDFCKYWSYAGIIDQSLNIQSIHSPPYDDMDLVGPLKGCGMGCFEYWLKCQGPFRFFINHEASNQQVTKKQYKDWGGCDPSGCYFRLLDKQAVSN
jgi:calpain-15